MLDAELATARADPRRRFGRYLLLAELGRGGMGVVYRAWDEPAGRAVALKVLPEGDADADRRFMREAEALAALAHPGVVPIHASGIEAGRRFFAMALVEGGSLRTRLREQGPRALPLARRVALLRDVARAVHAAHERGIVHRDLKPENVLVDRDDRAYVADFGLARFVDGKSRLTATGTALGTPAYMSPEQIEGSGVDARSDVYGLGATLFFALTGRPPFEGPTPVNVVTAALRHDAPPPSSLAPDVPPALDAICLRCLEKEPAARFPSAGALAAALDDYLAGGVGPRPIRRRRPGRALALGGAALAATGAGLALAIGLQDPDPVSTTAPTPARSPTPAVARPRAVAAPPETAPVVARPVKALELVWESPALGERAWTVAISPDGTHLAAGSYGGALRMWTLTPGAPAGASLAWERVEPSKTDAPAEVKCLVFSSDGRRITSAGNRADVITRDVATGETRATNESEELDIVWDLAGRASGTVLALAGRLTDRAPTLLLELEADELKLTGRYDPPAGASSIDLLDGAGELLGTAPDPATTKLLLLDLANPGLRRSAIPAQQPLEAHLINGILATDQLAVAGLRQRRAVFAWNLATDASQVVEGPPGGGNVLCLAVAGDTLLAGGYDGVISAWTIQRRKVSYAWAHEGAHPGEVPCLAVSPDGQLLASVGFDGVVRLWRLVR